MPATTGVIGATGIGLGGYAVAGPIGFALPNAGIAMRALQNRMTVAQGNRLSELARMNSPLASSMAKFDEAAAKLASEAKPKNQAGLVLAARNLSNNLKAAGINVSVAEIVKSQRSTKSE